MFKSSIIFASTCFLLFGFSLKQNNVKLIEATSERWSSGQNGGGSGKEYTIKIKILSSAKIEFDSLWINNISLSTFLANDGPAISSGPKNISKNDIVIVRCTEINSVKNKTMKAPIKYKGEGLLRYFINQQPNYIVIKKFKLIKNTNQP